MSYAFDTSAFSRAQSALADLKIAVVQLLAANPGGMKATQIARALGLSATSLGEQGGWIAWTVLKLLEADEVVRQEKERGPWTLNTD